MNKEKAELTTFENLRYTRPDFKAAKAFYETLNARLKAAKTYGEVRECIFQEEEFSSTLNTQATIAMVRHTIDTTDPFYLEEDEFINQGYPEIMPQMQAFNAALLESKFKGEIDKEFGAQFLKAVRLSFDSFSEKNVPLMQEENELTSRYQKLTAACKISFDGGEHNLYGILKYFSDPDREVRIAAAKKYAEFFEENEKELGEIFDRLVKIRHQMGENMGFENFVPLGYMQQGRLDYTKEDVAAFRKQVLEEIVPFCEEIYKAQAKRIGVDKIRFYDEQLIFSDGNAVPIGDRAYLVEQASKMYHELSDETGEFIEYMIDHQLMDLDNKPGKAATGYMTMLSDYKAPFVYSCFNGTTGDVDVLTHEMGHAFAGYLAARNQPLQALWSEPTDVAEIHSMAMEQFAYPYAELFFGEKAEQYRFQHLQEAITFVPFGVAVDEFQHIVYERPNLTPDERTAIWRSLEKKYMPWRDYGEDNPFFAKGGWWYHKPHIFQYPFYYINYTLTTMGALEFKKKAATDFSACWRDYTTLCRVGGSLGYLETLKAANLAVPFEEGGVRRAVGYALDILREKIAKE
ncbi:MAG: M3 family oligoendopeptidase [Clostridiales bacterium]|nr:M3 family oligoendopeptidase [Clostridiales bacterium]